MKKPKNTFLTNIIGLIVLLVLGLIIYFSFQNLKIVQLIASFFIISAYIGWGLWEHKQNKNLNKDVIIEYLSIGLLALALLFFLIYHD